MELHIETLTGCIMYIIANFLKHKLVIQILNCIFTCDVKRSLVILPDYKEGSFVRHVTYRAMNRESNIKSREISLHLCNSVRLQYNMFLDFF